MSLRYLRRHKRLHLTLPMQYQSEQIPLFLFHLKARLPQLYNEILKLDPSIASRTPTSNTFTKLKCKLCHIPNNTQSGFFLLRLDKCIKVNNYDGTTLSISGIGSDFLLFMDTTPETEATLTYIPDKSKTNVLVNDSQLIQQILTIYPELMSCAS